VAKKWPAHGRRDEREEGDMGRKYKIVSGDGHVETPPDGGLKYVPEQNRDRAPRVIRLPGGADGWLVEGEPMLHNGQNIKGR